MQTINIPITEQVLAGLKYLGAGDEGSQMDMARRLISEYLDDVALGGLAAQSEKQGFESAEDGEKWLASMKNAED